MSVSEKCVDKLFSLHNITLRSTISRLAEEFAGGNGFYPKILFIHPRWMIKDVARSLDNATPLLSLFFFFKRVLRSHEHLQPRRRRSIAQRERKDGGEDRDTDFQQSAQPSCTDPISERGKSII